MVAWQPVGLAMGVYDMCARYVRERRQFGAPLGAFQLVQERLSRMQGDVQAMFLMAWRLSVLHEQARPPFVCCAGRKVGGARAERWHAGQRAGHVTACLAPVCAARSACCAGPESAGTASARAWQRI